VTGESDVPGQPAVPGRPAAADDPPVPVGTSAWVPVGTPVRDTAHDRIGVVASHRVLLRPLDGGPTWNTAPEHLEPVGPKDVLHARAAEANHRSRRGRPG
jgi:hypothetical protein